MASSELSSSDIYQGQGEYHDGRNEANGIPPLAAPLAPSQVILEAEDSMWKKYSSHYEFPLSIVIAVGIHVIAILFVVAFMTLQFNWSKPVPLVEQYEEPRINNDNSTVDKPNAGGHTGDNGDNAKDPFSPQFDPLTLQKDTEQLKLPDPTDPIKVLGVPDRPLSQLQSKRPGQPGKEGIGQGGEEGNGFGPHSGGSSMGRNKRWRINFQYDEPEAFLAQLTNLRLVAAGRLNNGRYQVYKNLATSGTLAFEEMVDTAFASFVNADHKLWFISTERATCDNFSYAVNTNERFLTLVIVIPPQMEQAILAAELQHHRMTENEIRAKRLATSFRVVREGEQWKVTVVKAEVLK